LETFKDSLLLIANEGFISMLDMSKFPPLSSDFHDYVIPIPDLTGGLTTNSACSVGLPATKAPRGLTLISENKKNVHK